MGSLRALAALAAPALLAGCARAVPPPAASAAGDGNSGGSSASAPWDTYSDTWVAVDGLGRALPTYKEVGPPRPDRHVGIFYFLWLGAHVNGGPYDNTKILAKDPDALLKPDSPLWGPPYAPHYWGEPLFGYYLTDDRYVLRKHAQMLSDAGVEAVIFDASNKLTYKPWYTPLLDEFAAYRERGGSPPRVAFLCPFWEPRSTFDTLYRELYQPGIHPELWYRWEGKPLILADPARLRGAEAHVPMPLEPGRTLGQSFHADLPFQEVAGSFPTWNTVGSGVTLTLRRDGPQGPVVATRREENVVDNAWTALPLPAPQPPGTYYLEISDPRGHVGWWTLPVRTVAGGAPYADGKAADASVGDREIRPSVPAPDSTPTGSFFTFRAPEPSYFVGPTGPDRWSWLEVYPQHVFPNARGEKEEMSVGVAQNAVNGQLGAMSYPGAHGRSWHGGKEDTSPGAVRQGLNFAEQFGRALKEDPRFIFVTGWNEWIAGRFVNRPVKEQPFKGYVPKPGESYFVDEFNEEGSRDIEPMRGGHGDDYYYQLVGFIRRYKGVRPLPPVTEQTISLAGPFTQWDRVQPEFRDDIGDPARRDHPGWNHVATYRNTTGRNDIVAAKVAFDDRSVYFTVRTRAALTPPTGDNWMLLLLNTDGNYKNGWLGYDFVVNRIAPEEGQAFVQRHTGKNGAFSWGAPVAVPCRIAGNDMVLSLPRSLLGIKKLPATIDFKWADNCLSAAPDWSDFTLNGDAAPNDRFNYRARLEPPSR